MKTVTRLLLIVLLAPGICFAQSSTFTYQGKLASAGAAANGDYQFEFKLFDSDLAGNQVGTTQTVVASVQNGIFTTSLDFGAASFPADAGRWLEIGVRANGSTDAYTLLNPRQQINSVPFAIRSLRATDADNAANLGGVASGNFVQTDDARLADARPPAPGSGNYIQNSVVQQFGNFNISGNALIGGSLSARSLIGDGSGLTNIRASFPWQAVAAGAQQAHPNTGYVVTTSVQATITLPQTPNVGDVIRVTSAGQGGWKIAQNDGQTVLVGNLGLVGHGWAPHESDRNWRSIASSADGTRLAAVVDGGRIYTSSDAGVSWIARDVDRYWSAIASSADGTKLVATVHRTGGARSGPIYTSTDSGVTWTLRNVNAQWSAVASSDDGNNLVAVANRIYTSNDSGVSWTPRESLQSWSSVASSADGTKLVAVTNSNSGGQIYTSTDAGASWTSRNVSERWNGVASSADGSKLVAVSMPSNARGSIAKIYTSSDSGANWTAQDSESLSAVASSADGTKLIAAASSGQLYLSNDSGLSWTLHASSRQWAAVASSADGSRLVAVVNGGQIYTSFGSSSSTTTIGTAGDLVGGALSAIELQFIGNGVWIPISHEGTIVGH
jgi:hypothetical protein